MSSDYQSAAEKQRAVREAIFPALEHVEQVFQDINYTVKYKSEEFNSVCPKTGLPDFATIEIEYQPDKYLVELKSLKLYLNAFRNVGVFQEHAANKVFQDFWKAADPRYLKVVMTFGARGGIDTRVEVEQRRIEMLGTPFIPDMSGTTAAPIDFTKSCQ